jgi:hypothetical protein
VEVRVVRLWKTSGSDLIALVALAGLGWVEVREVLAPMLDKLGIEREHMVTLARATLSGHDMKVLSAANERDD